MGAPRPPAPSRRVRLAPAATRMFGSDLLLSVGGATGPVKRLTGSGPELWRAFGQGDTIAEAAARVAARTGESPEELETHVAWFAAALVEEHLAEIAW